MVSVTDDAIDSIVLVTDDTIVSTGLVTDYNGSCYVIEAD